MALQHSQGQQAATIQGTANQGVCIQDSVANHGFNAGQLIIASGGAPANGNTAQSGTVGILFVTPNPCFAAASGLNSASNMNAVSNVNAAASITAGYFRLTTGTTGTGFPTLEDGTLSTTQRRIQGSVGTSGADLNLNTTTIPIGAACSLSGVSYTHPN